MPENRDDQKAKLAPLWLIGAIRIFLVVVSKLLWGLKFSGKENIPASLDSGLLIAPNHQSYFDPFWIAIPVRRRMRFMAWDKACEAPLIGPLIRYLGAFPVDTQKGGKESVANAIRALRDGATLVVFPEGSRGFSDGKLLAFKPGAARIALAAGVPILPVTIKGANRVWPQDKGFPGIFRRVEIIYHPILDPASFLEAGEKEAANEITLLIREMIEKDLA